MWYITALIFGFFLVGGIVYYARKESANTARLNALKREIKERERANKVVDTVRAMPIDRVRDKLKNTK